MATVPDLTALTDEQLDEWVAAVTAEAHRRQVLTAAADRAAQVKADADAALEAITTEYLTARDGAPDEAAPAPFVRPQGAHDAYPEGWVVTHDGKTWRSIIAGNAHEPGTDHGQAWVQVAPDPEPGGHVPWDVGQQVKAGDERTHEGRLWRAKLDHVTHEGWAPSVHAHAVWTDLGPLEDA